MLDIKLIRESPDLVRENLKRRQDPEALKRLDQLINADREWRETKRQMEDLHKQRNELTREIAELKKKGKGKETPAITKKIRQMKGLPVKIRELDEQTGALQQQMRWHLMRIPNLLHESVPVGKDDTENVEVRRWGKPPRFDFPPKNHQELMERLGLMESAQAAQVAGAGFFYLKGPLALLDLALQRFAIDVLTGRGYTLIEPPLMLRREPYEGVVELEAFENVMYKIDQEDLYLIATSEHPMAAMYMNHVLPADRLPLRLIGVSPCFRKEIGSHGKYTRGLFRMHQFNKVEQFIFCRPDDSAALHEELQKNSEDIYRQLGLHYRVVNVCTGDIGVIAAKKYDTEVWMADGQFREAGSNSNCTDYQARRLNIRFREKEGQAPAGFVHTLNNTAIATSRVMIAIIEQCQQKDGSIKIPDVLVPYMNGMRVIK